MVDLEKIVYDLLQSKVPEISWTGGFSSTNKMCGTIKAMKNIPKISSSSSIEHIQEVAVRIQFWVRMPEKRFPLENKINSALTSLGLKRISVNHLEDERSDNSVYYRSIVTFGGVYDEMENRFYFS